ncbi:MAG: response regulator transcription factor [Candidatus Rokubacteria bacterium]|nr:response regulator transcription factor [Candidatus Rokubacteria bacterium]
MKILVAEDDPVWRKLVPAALDTESHDVVVVPDGAEASRLLLGDDPPALAILDWVMPGMTGLEICQRLRHAGLARPPYLILVTSMGRPEDIAKGFEAGADDYITKPFDASELRARVHVGIRMIGLQDRLAERVTELEEAMARVRQLDGLLPICAWCKKIRNDGNYWQQVEHYITEHTDARFSHSICPECRAKHVEPEIERLRRARASEPPPPPL